MRFGVFILAAVLAACSGCAQWGGAAEPYTEIKVGRDGVRFYDSKDNEIAVDGLDVDPATKHFKVEKLVIRNNASDVRIASVQQMDAFNRQLVTHGENITRLGDIALGLAETIAPLALPGLKLKGPLGGEATVNSASMQALIEALKPAIEKMVGDAVKAATSSVEPTDPLTPLTP